MIAFFNAYQSLIDYFGVKFCNCQKWINTHRYENISNFQDHDQISIIIIFRLLFLMLLTLAFS